MPVPSSPIRLGLMDCTDKCDFSSSRSSAICLTRFVLVRYSSEFAISFGRKSTEATGSAWELKQIETMVRHEGSDQEGRRTPPDPVREPFFKLPMESASMKATTRKTASMESSKAPSVERAKGALAAEGPAGGAKRPREILRRHTEASARAKGSSCIPRLGEGPAG